jgi:hypothetical protein
MPARDVVVAVARRHVASSEFPERFACLGVLLLVLAGGCESSDRGDASGDGGVWPCAERGGDRDGDHVCDADDNCPARANSTQSDGDDDGEGDACDRTPERCDDRGGDSDDDGVCEHDDNCPELENPAQRDRDGDGAGDACDGVNSSELCAGNGGDADDDDVCQAGDNCEGEPNPDQRDADHDGRGDACDTTPEPCDELGGDSDADTICDRVDNCVDTANVTQFDRDVDGIGDVCDADVPGSAADGACAGVGGDDDGDDWCGIDDNCPAIANEQQQDADDDGIGDGCDVEECDGIDNDGNGAVDEGAIDTDDDGHADCVDSCPSVPDGDQDADGVGDCADICPEDASNDIDFDRICGQDDNCPFRSNLNQSDRDGDGLGDACDVEECDGLSNDADTLVDEGMADEDGDRVCDAVDMCPGDPGNDKDGDGTCAATDSCPETFNAGDTDTDSDGIGDVCDLDARCDAAVPLLAVGAEPLPALDNWADMAIAPNGQTLYALAGAMAVPYASEFLAIDLATRSVRWRIVLGGAPTVLAVATDGSRAWVAVSGSRAVRMIDLAARRRCGDFPIWSATRQLLQPQRLAVIPGVPGSLVVQSETGVTAIYDEGLPRPKTLASAANATPADADTIYSGASFSNVLNVHTIDEDGFQSVRAFEGLADQQPLLWRGGRLYSQSGLVADPAVPRLLADLPAQGPIDVDLERGEIYYAQPGAFGGLPPPSVSVWDAETFALIGTIERTPTTRLGAARRIFRWGEAGLVMLFNGDFSNDADVLWIVDDIDAELEEL